MKFDEFDAKLQREDAARTDRDSDFAFEVSHLITEARLKAGLTQAQLAKLVGTQQPSIARLEKGAQLPTLQFLKKVADAIGTHLIPPKFAFTEKRSVQTAFSMNVTIYPSSKVAPPISVMKHTANSAAVTSPFQFNPLTKQLETTS